jgi:predicted nucleic acid-binding protein
LLDVNILLGCSWKSHADHSALLDWLLQADEWATCPITELGFVRVSMTVMTELPPMNPQLNLTQISEVLIWAMAPHQRNIVRLTCGWI